jgi:hypothetical protein
MNFMQFLKSLDDLFYEIVTWLVFYPVTLLRVLRRPWSMMAYARTELEDAEEDQYSDTLSPPIFLLLTLLLSHAIELQLVGQNPLIAGKKGVAALITDDTSLLLVRMIFFSAFPLILSVRLLRHQKIRLTRDSLKQPFYAQCYPTALFALGIGMGVMLTHSHDGPTIYWTGWTIVAATLIWFGTLQAGWFRRMLDVGWLRGFGHASFGMAECVAIILIITPLIV